MNNIGFVEDSIVRVQSVKLPKAKFVKFKPHSKDFLDISDPKHVLELQLRKFSCLTKGMPICIQYIGRNYLIDVVDLKPSDAVSIIETDCEVDFEAPRDYIEPDWKNQGSSASQQQAPVSSPSIVWGGGSTNLGSGTVTSPFVLDDDSSSSNVRNTSPLTASGESSTKRARASEAALSRLGGSASTPQSNTPATDPSGGKESKFGLKFTPFQCEGRTLGAPPATANRSPTLHAASMVGGQVISTGANSNPKKEKTLNKFEAMKKETISFQGTGRKLA